METKSSKQIPAGTRYWHIAMSSLLLAYGACGLYIDDIYIPGKRSRGIHVHGWAAWIMFGAFICAALNLLSVVVDYYDKRDDERIYESFAKVMQVAGWGLFGISVVWELFGPKRLSGW